MHPRHEDVSNDDVTTVDVKKEFFSFKSNSMQFFKADGMKEATGYGEPRHWYFVIIKELLDNGIDWEREYYVGSMDAKVSATFTISKDYKTLNCKVRNSNPDNKPIYAFQQLHNILNYSMTFGSKQNEYRRSRGQLGDGLKRLIGLPFILMNIANDESAFFKKQWDTHMYFRANGIERQVTVNVNLGASTATNQIIESPKKLPHTDTEVEITLPIIEQVVNDVTLQAIAKHCRLSILTTTDISFHIEIVNKASQTRGFTGKEVISLEAKHPVMHNPSSTIEAYRGSEFVNRLESFYDRQNSLYQLIRKFKEGAQIQKSKLDKIVGVKDIDKLSLEDFMNFPDYQQKMQKLYYALMKEVQNG